MGMLFMAVSLGSLRPPVLYTVLKGNTTELYVRFMQPWRGTMAEHSVLMKTLALSPVAMTQRFVTVRHV